MLLAAVALGGCSREAREIGPAPPQIGPQGNADLRITLYQDNVYQVSQGGRYFDWYGCAACHGENAPGVRNLTDDTWRYGSGFAQVYAAIASRHGRLAYAQRVPTEQLWQLAAFTRDLSQHTPEKRRRQTIDQQAEPQAAHWQGPL